MKFGFIVYQVEGYQNMLKLSCKPVVLPHIKLFQKTKRSWTSLAATFPALFLKKTISLVTFS